MNYTRLTPFGTILNLCYSSPGRRKSILLGLFGLGSACLTMAWLPKDYEHAVLATYLVGKFCGSFSASICWLFTSELFPTNLRSQALGFCSMMAR